MKKNIFKITNLIFFGILTIYIYSISMVSGANFISATKAKSKATIAKLDIITNSSLNTMMQLDCNNSVFTSDYEFSVTDNSDVSINYNIITELPENFPFTVDLKLLKKVDNNYQEVAYISKSKNEYIWSNRFNINDNVKQHDYLLRFSYNSYLDINRNVGGIKIKIYGEQGD